MGELCPGWIGVKPHSRACKLGTLGYLLTYWRWIGTKTPTYRVLKISKHLIMFFKIISQVYVWPLHDLHSMNFTSLQWVRLTASPRMWLVGCTGEKLDTDTWVGNDPAFLAFALQACDGNLGESRWRNASTCRTVRAKPVHQ